MGKKSRAHPNVEEILDRPWCYYCERDFEDLKLLISHQKAKHFKCDRCGRRLNTAGGLSVHLNQVHKENLDHVENALPNRSGLEVEIFGMEGIPAEALDSHRNRLVQNYYQAQEERRVATGNAPPGQTNRQRKPIVVESEEELLRRLREWREQKKAGGPMDGVVQTGQAQQQPQQQYQGYSAQPIVQEIPSHPAAGVPIGLPQRPGGDDIDNLIRMAEAGVKPAEVEAPKAAKKEKDKKGKMFYEDAEIAPEEKMAHLRRYAFDAAV